MSRPHLQLGGERWNVWRLADEEFRILGQHALPIRQNYELLLRLNESRLGRSPPATLGHLLTALECQLGASSSWFDGYRGSFAFPLLLTLQRQRRVSYLLRCHDHRGLLYFPFYRIVLGDPNPEERSAYHEPVADEFSQTEMDDFVSQFHGHLCEYARHLDANSGQALYYRAIGSDLILYGHDGCHFFERQYANLPQFETARIRIDRDLGRKHPHSSSDRVERMIDRVTEVPDWGDGMNRVA